MISSKSPEPDYLTIKERQKSLQKHYEKLQEIKHSSPKRYFSGTQSSIKPKSSISHQRKKEISQSNRILLSKITTISQRKFVPPITKPSRPFNTKVRKEAARKINEDNEHLAERLLSKKPIILKKDQDKAFKLSKKYRVQVSKKRLILLQEASRSKSPSTGKRGVYSSRISSEQKSDREKTSATPLPVTNQRGAEGFVYDLESDSSYSENFDD